MNSDSLALGHDRHGMNHILSLARRLREEQLFCKSEQESIRNLHGNIIQSAESLGHTFWTSRQHRLNLDKLITDNAQGTPAICCQRSNQLSCMQFADAYKLLGYQQSLYGTFLQSLRSNPTLVGACLAYGDKLGLTSTHNVVDSLVLCLYGNNVIADDHRNLLELMETLMLLQLANEERPRRVLQKGNSAFCIVYKLFTDSLMSSKLFLTAALHSPVMNVVLSTDLLLETDPAKILDCFSAEEAEKRFGRKDDPNFQTRVQDHLQRTEEQLVDICTVFVNSLQQNLHRFPNSLRWVISRAYHIVKDAENVSETESMALCADLVMQSFICPAIVNPELYAISGDIPITEITRFNLMQIAQLLQMFALSSDQHQTMFRKFDKSCIQSLLTSIVENSYHADDPPPSRPITEGFVDSAAFMTPQQLFNITEFMYEIQRSNVHGVDQSSLSEILSHLPTSPPEALLQHAVEEIMKDETSSVDTPTKTKSKSVEHDLKNKFKDRGQSSASSNDSRTSNGPDSTVIAISLLQNDGSKPPGLLSESEVLQRHHRFRGNGAVANGDNHDDDGKDDKRLRFSAFSTGGNTIASDMSEGGIENSCTGSNSSMDDLDQPESMQADDTSSFHGTSSHGNQEDEAAEDIESAPHTNNDEALKALERKLPTSRESIEDKMRKFEIRSQLGVRFGGTFVAPGNSTGNYADTRSETWSTDAHLSDSEAPTEQEDGNDGSGRLQEIAEDPNRQPSRNSASASPYLAVISRDDDSRSDVWSVEVLPSDSEPTDVKPEDRLQELESESNTGGDDERDPLEDSRSRASTPGLSAASGVSGTSGLSLVSDNIHARGMHAEEQGGSSSEKSYGKGASPDADDMLLSNTKRSETIHPPAHFAVPTATVSKLPSKRVMIKEQNVKVKQKVDKNSEANDGEKQPNGVLLTNSDTIKRSPFKKSLSETSGKSSEHEAPSDDQNDLLMTFDPLMKPSSDESKPLDAWSVTQVSNGTRPKYMKPSDGNTSSSPFQAVKGNDRKKPWWKTNRFTSKRKSPTNIRQSSSSSDIMSPEQSSPLDTSDTNVENVATVLHSSPIKYTEDIMEKYMRKAASVKKPSSSPGEVYFSIDDKPSNATHSDTMNTTETLNSGTDGHVSSATSEGTVTTATNNLSNQFADDKVMTQQNTSETVRVEEPRIPTSDELITDAVKKIRMILSTSDPYPDPVARDGVCRFDYDATKDVNHNHHQYSSSDRKHRSQLLSFLHLQLSERINLQEHARVTQLRETIRCVRRLTDEQTAKAVQQLWFDYKQRSVYVEYLIRTKQSLLTALAYIKHLSATASKSEETCKRYFTSVCVRLFLRKKDANMKGFRMQFSKFTASDEKVAFVNQFLSWLYGQLAQDTIMQDASEVQLNEAERSLERSVFCCVYKLALFPNGDGDQLRDQLYHEHISRLRKVVTPHHPALLIPDKYLLETPWSPAQNEIALLNAYRTPREKVACVIRCCDVILNLLKMADSEGVPGADDFTPVLVYVLIMANPASLLSTVQYVSSFLGNTLTGEEAYWWMQFTAATEFIKTIDERK